MKNSLSTALTELAEDVQPVDLHDRVLATSRRLRARRAVAGSLAVVALAAGATYGAVRALPSERALPPAEPVVTIPGTVYFASSELPAYTVYRLAPGGELEEFAKFPSGALGETVALSPDGHRAAWVTVDGAVMVGRTDGSEATKVGTQELQSDCGRPSWSPDGGRVAFVSGGWEDSALMVADADGSPVAEVDQTGGCFPVWSPDGRRLAYVQFPNGSLNSQLLTVQADGTARRVVPVQLRDPAYVRYPVSISNDGAKVVAAVGEPDGCNCPEGITLSFADRLIDGLSGEVSQLTCENALLTPDGGLLLRVAAGDAYTLELRSPDGALLASWQEPKWPHETRLLRYVP
ncbi:PD40 domain-containing protein [Phytohabitans rumicis]|uniref:Lipoprotein LpqB beta-propeller domain-containing protein n=1 Tax=Phytohabitans rumicis TaxID=1076125 RepID=A0A6V8L379_9ACTN|nr:PD40 domain-containing protein [Phytohabitans rumicis]GFJ89990.1 hypothetical protein Prum_036320 [Phytohabitans rumicis]